MKPIISIISISWLLLGFQISRAWSQNTPCAESGGEQAAFAECVNAMVTNYIELKDALLNGNTGQTAREATEFWTFLNELNVTTLKAQTKTKWVNKKIEIMNVLEHISKASHISTQRSAFANLSSKVEALVEVYGPVKQTLYKQFCPKALDGEGAYWLNEKKEILNPYEGGLHCGEIVEMIEAKGSGD